MSIYTVVGMLKMSRSEAYAYAVIKMHVNPPENVVCLVFAGEPSLLSQAGYNYTPLITIQYSYDFQ